VSDAQDPYLDVARYYDAENADLVEDLPAYELLAERFGGPVLEIGCGTGRVALYLARNGTRVIGADPSDAMLKRARQRAAEFNLPTDRLAWHQAEAASIDLDERFKLAILAFGTFQHLITTEEQIAALERIAAHLTPGAGIAIDLPNPIPAIRADDLPALIVDRIFTDPETGHTVFQQSLSRLDPLTQVLEVTWVYDRISEDGQVTRQVVPMRLRQTLAAEMRLLLERTGFQNVESYGSYDFDPYQAESDRLFIVATRI
jgi:SAM-dependent methyltransferase